MLNYISGHLYRTQVLMTNESHPYTLWKDQKFKEQKYDWSAKECHDYRLEENYYLNMIEEDILSVFEAFDRKMCFDRGVPYDIAMLQPNGLRSDERQIILPDAELIASTITPELVRERLTFLFGVCGTGLFLHTFIQRVCAYLEAKKAEVEVAIQSNFHARNRMKHFSDLPPQHYHDIDTRQALSCDSTLLQRILNVYDEQLHMYSIVHQHNIRFARYEKRHTTHFLEEDPEACEKFLTSRVCKPRLK